MDEIAQNLTRHVFYHGTHLDTVERIHQEGFRERFYDEDGDPSWSGGNLGTGIYITCNWRIALWFGSTLLSVGLQPGTRILDAVVPPDPNILAYLRREFGREIFKKPLLQVIPRNKQLTLPELVNLFRYQYRMTWEKDYGRSGTGFSRWPRQRMRHEELLADFRSLLARYGFHGYGNPEDDNGIVIFAGDRVILKELIAEVPPAVYEKIWPNELEKLGSVDFIRSLFDAYGSERARGLAEQIAAARAPSRR
jgi:hypothetical protein